MSKPSHILNVLKQALITFTTSKHKAESFPLNLEALIALLDKTTAEHVNFPRQYLNPQLWEHPDKAPVSCIEIFEDDHLTMGIFILKPNGKLPLHNHPQMHGLIKVIAGQVKIVSYSLNTDKTQEVDNKSFQDSRAPMPFKPKAGNYNIVTAELNEITIAGVNSPPCVLEPNYKNLHEIQSLNEPAAFLDILAPPYGYSAADYEPRKCSYYNRLSQVSSDVFRLQEIRSPLWYWTDSHPYTGPDLYEADLSN